MPKKLRLPPEVTATLVEKYLKTAPDPFARDILNALQSALAGNSAESCARSVGKKRRWLFQLLKRIQRRGLAVCLFRRHGGGMTTTIPVSVLKQMDAEFRAGKTARWITVWLKKRKVFLSIDGVNYWKRKRGFVRKRRKSKAILHGQL